MGKRAGGNFSRKNVGDQRFNPTQQARRRAGRREVRESREIRVQSTRREARVVEASSGASTIQKALIGLLGMAVVFFTVFAWGKWLRWL